MSAIKVLKHMKRILSLCIFMAVLAAAYCPASDARQRSVQRFNDGWKFALGNASDPAKDFGCGTEYFNYLTKAASIHNAGPYSMDFKDSLWQEVTLPHDWVVDLPFAPEASHSHGYKTVGWKYPETSVGWYRKEFFVPEEDDGSRIVLRFDGIFRDSRVWVNGFYCGGEPSGYLGQEYEISDYLDYGGRNVVCVRADASLEEGWFYEGAGIYRNVWLEKTAPLHVAGVFASSDGDSLRVRFRVENASAKASGAVSARLVLEDRSGVCAASAECRLKALAGRESMEAEVVLGVPGARRWDVDDPYLYTLKVQAGDDCSMVKVGLRDMAFDPDRGFFLNGRRVEIKGVNLHQDAAGVGSAIPDALHLYRVKKILELGCNAIRCSHNPASPALLDICDSLGVLVIDENRLLGSSSENRRQLQSMIERDFNHPSIILWSIGNEEWGVEWKEKSERIVATMREWCHRLDPSRPVTVATSSGPNVVVEADVAGYNYYLQNDIDGLRARYPSRRALGTEETSGCGTRGVYFADAHSSDGRGAGRMPSLNRSAREQDGALNRIEEGWKFYSSRPWLAGVFWWTGIDYRGEPNPLSFPATGSEFGILDYCCFPKDEAWYLRSVWTEEPVLHVFPDWNLPGHEGGKVEIWAYSNCDEVQLWVNGKSLGRKKMPSDGHLVWDAVYRPGKLRAVGYRNGRRVLSQEISTPGAPAGLKVSREACGDLIICNLEVVDASGRFCSDACVDIDFSVSGPARILGVGNGDPAWQETERPLPGTGQDTAGIQNFSVPSFNGRAQILLLCEAGSSPGQIATDVSLDASLPNGRPCRDRCGAEGRQP